MHIFPETGTETPVAAPLDEPIDCACGKIHEEMPVIMIDEDEEGIIWAEAVCRVHHKHIPCRRCLYSDPEFLKFRDDLKASFREMDESS